MEEFGSYLKSQREKKGIRLEEIASITKIHLHNLELLEAGKLEKLPPEPFLRGFITAYAKYVGLNARETMDKYSEMTGTAAAAPTNGKSETTTSTRHAAPAASEHPEEVLHKFQLPSWPKLATAGGLFIVAGVSLLLMQVGKNSDAPSSAPTQPTVASQTAPAGTPATGSAAGGATSPADPSHGASEARIVAGAATTAPQDPKAAPKTDSTKPAQATAAAAPQAVAEGGSTVPDGPVTHKVEIETKERTWVKVVVDAEPPTEFFLSPGKRVEHSAKQKIKVVLGNASGATVLHNGEPAEGKLFMGTIRSFRFPANAQFPQDVPKPTAVLTPASTGSDEKSEKD